MMRRRAILLAALTAAAPATASSPGAWAAGDRAAVRACLAASGLARATASARLLFSDATMTTAMLVDGVYPQRHMKGAKGTMLCLYDRKAKRAEAVEAKGWRVR